MFASIVALFAPHAIAAEDDWALKLEGYYRVRGAMYPGLYADLEGTPALMRQRLRLQPEVDYKGLAKFVVQMDALDGVVVGDNASFASTALFASEPSSADANGQEVPPIRVKRAFTEFRVPIGLMRVGRQGNDWGMGLLANGGDGFDDPFGENEGGSTTDRILFATRPIDLVTTIAGSPKEVPLILAVAVDRLVEDPLVQYYGYSCDVEDEDDGCEPRESHGVTEERTSDERTSSWWADAEDDVWEMLYVVTYRGEGIRLGSQVGDVVGGMYVVNRLQGETDSNVWIVDGHVKVRIAGVYVEGEVVHIGGETRAITLENSDAPDDPFLKTADIWSYAVRAGYERETWSAVIEHGYASGDADATDAVFTGRPAHADYNVGLVLYDEILARTTAATWGDSARGLWSNGGVYNSRYLFPNATFRPAKGWDIIGAFLVAWPDRPDGTNILCDEDDDCAQALAESPILGWEADLAVKVRFHEHMLFSLESGYARATDRLPLAAAGLATDVDDDGNEYGDYFTLQTRIAYEF